MFPTFSEIGGVDQLLYKPNDDPDAPFLSCVSAVNLIFVGFLKKNPQIEPSLLFFLQGWTKPNAFHVCITSYKLVLQDHQAFRRKSWRYLILDEAQNIKNFKSQRWQSLLNFNRSVELVFKPQK